MSRKPIRDWYGPLELDADGAYSLQRFAQHAYLEWRDGVPIPKRLEAYAFNDYRSRLYWKISKMYEEGAISFDLTLFDKESDKPPVDLSKLTQKFSKEV